MEAMQERLAADYERQAASAAARLTAVLEPALILLLSGVVASSCSPPCCPSWRPAVPSDPARRVSRLRVPLRRPRPNRPRRRRVRAGFTLVELMVVVVIVGLLAGAVTFGVRGYLLTGKRNVARLELAKIAQALDTYYTVHDRYPENEEGLDALAAPSAQFPDGILDRVSRNPWGRPYQYSRPGRSGPYEVLCLGADGREDGTGGDADISSEDLGPEARP